MIGALGIFTPMILLIILAAFFTVLTGDPVPWKEMLETGQEIESSLPNVYVSVVNYFALCMMTSTSMLFVLGGSIMGLKNAKKGGILGGFFTGMITVLIALLLVSRIDLVADANVPMQKLLGLIHPTLGFLMTFHFRHDLQHRIQRMLFACQTPFGRQGVTFSETDAFDRVDRVCLELFRI